MANEGVMADRLDALRRLQAVDAQLFRLRQDQQRKPRELEQVKQQAADQEAKLQAAEARLKALQVQQRDKDVELSTREATVKKLQGQLFQVKTNKEYTAMQHEIDQTKADISLFEEEILTLLETIEQTKREVAAQRARVSEEHARLTQEQTRVDRELAQIQEQIAALERQRQTITPLVEPSALSVYERVLSIREGVALVPLINDSCGGCHMVQPPQVVNEVCLKAKLVTCESCSRILYLDEPASG